MSNNDHTIGNMEIGGIPVKDMQEAYAQYPLLSRWHTTTLKLISDLYNRTEELEFALVESNSHIEKLENFLEELDEPEEDQN